MYKENKEPWQVRSMFPDVALHLETKSIIMTIREDLQLSMMASWGKKNSRIRIPLTDEYILQIAPVDRGYEGYAEWFSYGQDVDQETGANIVTQSIRTCVTLLKGERPDQKIIVSFTTHCPDIEETIRLSMRIIFSHIGQRLTPQTRPNVKNWKKSA
jgi:hypothetical protein